MTYRMAYNKISAYRNQSHSKTTKTFLKHSNWMINIGHKQQQSMATVLVIANCSFKLDGDEPKAKAFTHHSKRRTMAFDAESETVLVLYQTHCPACRPISMISHEILHVRDVVAARNTLMFALWIRSPCNWKEKPSQTKQNFMAFRIFNFASQQFDFMRNDVTSTLGQLIK